VSVLPSQEDGYNSKPVYDTTQIQLAFVDTFDGRFGAVCSSRGTRCLRRSRWRNGRNKLQTQPGRTKRSKTGGCWRQRTHLHT